MCAPTERRLGDRRPRGVGPSTCQSEEVSVKMKLYHSVMSPPLYTKAVRQRAGNCQNAVVGDLRQYQHQTGQNVQWDWDKSVHFTTKAGNVGDVWLVTPSVRNFCFGSDWDAEDWVSELYDTRIKV